MNYPPAKLLICIKDIPVVVVPPFRSLRTPPALVADGSAELPALRENIRHLQQRLSTAELCLTGLIGVFQGQLIDQTSGQLPEWLQAYVKEGSKEPDHLPSTSNPPGPPPERQGPSPGRTIYSPRTQRPLNPPLPMPAECRLPTVLIAPPQPPESVAEPTALPAPTEEPPVGESSLVQPDGVTQGTYVIYSVTGVCSP